MELGYIWKLYAILVKKSITFVGGIELSTLRKMLFASLGLVVITKERAERWVSELVAEGEVTAEEGRELLNRMAKRVALESDDVKQRIQDESRRAMTGVGLASHDEVQALRLRIEKLESELRSKESESLDDSTDQ